MAQVQGRDAVAGRVSRETLGRLDVLADLLTHWQKTINLVAPNTIPDLWNRHIADSLQLVDHAPANAKSWVDLGSGGGFPGLVVAAVLAERDGASVTLVESDTRKAAFLREASRAAGLPARIVPQRIEQASQGLAQGTQVVSARALAPLPKLLDLAEPFLAAGALGLFPKGRDYERELTEALKGWTLDLNLHRSLGDPHGRILAIASAHRLAAGLAPGAGPDGGSSSLTGAAAARPRAR